MNNDKFYCPYAVHRRETIHNVTFEDDNGKCHTQSEIVNQAGFVVCLRERCGVFYDGKCHYNGSPR